eukprot:TRINITY_DN17842_c0_g1_i1.p1 TRINITY_DN17842_c0_g1~~TRINITY_DN17842_c0_g1_i1.p1  ORF type:complete len:480 (+),score=59.96 TRINITY_DN17842_c0_g1_i1:80-1519(+)
MNGDEACSSTSGRQGAKSKRRVLIVGGGLAGLAAARELRHQFRVMLVDAKEYFEFTSGIFRAYGKPEHWDSLTFLYNEVLERNLGVGFIWGEVMMIDSQSRCAHIRGMFADETDVVPYDFCVIAGGCNFNQFLPTGESPWFPTVHARDQAECEMRHLDERFLEGRRRRILEEHNHLVQLERQQQEAEILIVGAGFMGVEWACELRHYFPGLRITVSDFLPRCLGPLPEAAANYCQEYMVANDIKTFYGVKYDKDNPAFWARIGLPHGADKTYILSGVKNSNYFMPKNTLSDKGPGGGGWILTNRHLQVVTRQGEKWGQGLVFAVGDCTMGCVGEAPNWELPPVPKTGYPAEQQAVHACRNIRVLDKKWYGGASDRCCGCLPLSNPLGPTHLRGTWYPWGAGIFAVSLGPRDGCVVIGAKDEKGSGRVWSTGLLAAAHKELIETTKIAHSRGDHLLSRFIWYSIHHFPINLWGQGPLISF